MPSHFKVKEYCPLVFRAFREYWKVHESSFRVKFIYLIIIYLIKFILFLRILLLNHQYLLMKQQNLI
jgi:hypothetical protein